MILRTSCKVILVLCIDTIISSPLSLFRGKPHNTDYHRYYPAQKSRKLICISDSPTDAHVWNTNLNWNTEQLAYSDRKLRQQTATISQYEGFYDKDSWLYQKTNWTVASSLNEPMGPVFDDRWEAFKEYRTFDPLDLDYHPVTFDGTVNSALSFRETGALVVSIRSTANVHILICASKIIEENLCYWLIIGGWNNNITAVRKCETGVRAGQYPDPKGPCALKRALRVEHWPLSNIEWKTFVITWEAASRTIKLYEPHKLALSYTDKEYIPNNVTDVREHYVYFGNPNKDPRYPTSFRFHAYNYYLTNIPEAKMITTPLRIIGDPASVCITMVVGLCAECQIVLRMLSENNRVVDIVTVTGWDLSKQAEHGLPMWKPVKLHVVNFDKNERTVTIDITTEFRGGEQGKKGHWAVTNFRECFSKGTIITTEMEASQDYNGTRGYFWPITTCQRLSYDVQLNEVINSAVIVSDPPRDVDVCPLYSIGPRCDTNCSTHFEEHCEFVTECNKQRCWCLNGYNGEDCGQICPSGTYGLGCVKRCDNCDEKSCDIYTGKCLIGCRKVLDRNAFLLPPYCEIAIEAPPVPVLSQINKTSVFAYLEMMNINKEANTTYSFGLVVKNCSKLDERIIQWTDAEVTLTAENDAPSRYVFYHSFEGLMPGVNYSIRAAINIHYEHNKSAILDGPITNFTTLCDSAQFNTVLEDRAITVLKVNKGNYSCPDTWYTAKLLTLSSDESKAQTVNANGLGPNFPMTFSKLTPYTLYEVSIMGRNGKYHVNKTVSTLEAPSTPVRQLKQKSVNMTEGVISWLPPKEINGLLKYYNVTIEVLDYQACVKRNEETPPDVKITRSLSYTPSENELYTIKDLTPYVTYNITVSAFNSKLGIGSSVVISTSEGVIPTSIFDNLRYNQELGKFFWKYPKDCWTINGPIWGAKLYFFGLSENVLNFTDQHVTKWHSFTINDTKKQDIHGSENYTVRVHVLHREKGQYNENAYCELSFTTKPSPPPMVRNLDIVEVDTEEELTTLRWQKPLPPTNGEIVKYIISFSGGYLTTRKKIVVFPNETCSLWPDSLCKIIHQPSIIPYNIEVRAYNKDVDTSHAVNKIEDTLTENAPEAPKIIHIREIEKGIVDFSWEHPTKTGGPLSYFSIEQHINSTDLEQLPAVKNNNPIYFPITDYLKFYTTQLQLLPSTHYNITVRGLIYLNGIFDKEGKPSSAEIETNSSPDFATQPRQPVVNENGPLIDMIIPSVVNNTRGSMLHIIVKSSSTCDHYSKLNANLEKHVKLEYHEVAWRAATLWPNSFENQSFTIGDNREYGGAVNCPLHVGNSYVVYLILRERQQENNKIAKTIVWESLPIQIGPVPRTAHEIWAIPLALLLIICAGIMYYITRKRKDQKNSAAKRISIGGPMILYSESVPTPVLEKSEEIPFPKPIEYRESLLLTPANSHELLPTVPRETYEKAKFTSLVKLNEFQDYVKRAIATGKLDQQYSMFPRGQTKSWEYGKLPQNKAKNRYGNLIAYDDTRVKLEKIADDPYSDYINANYIKGYKKNKAYIATQGPKPITIADFWRMVWQERVQIICMLANVLEGGKTKCEQYWPEIGKKITFGNISISNISHTVFADYTFRIFHVTCYEETRKIDHLHYTAWPDHGIPLYTQSVVTYLKKLLATPAGNGPVLVHCSAGVGRTGTIILCDICLRRAAAEGVVDVFGETEAIRNQRANMVDNGQQYLLAHLALVECLLTLPTAIACNDSLPTRIQEYKNQLTLQIQRLGETAWQDKALQLPTRSSMKLTENNFAKNRYPELVLSSRLYIPRYPTSDDDSNYIFGSYVDSARRRNNFIASQLPLVNTVGDFWRMIAGFKVELIIQLQSPDPDDSTCCKFLPEPDEDLKPVPFLNLKGRAIVDMDNCLQQKVFLIDTSENSLREQTITILTCKAWAPGLNASPPKPLSLVELWQMAERISRSEEPTVVLCHDGVTNCGLYLALSFILERMGLERECDVCLAIRAIRRSRPDFCKTVEQFEYLYDAALIYSQYFETYANFS